MREFFIANGQIIAVVIAGLEALLTLILMFDFIFTRRVFVLLMTLLALGLTYDAAVMAFGAWIPAEQLPLLSRIRFVSHGLLVPLNIALCGYVLRWNDRKLLKLWFVTLLLCMAGAASGFARVLELREFAGMVRYVAGEATPVWADKINRVLSFGTVLPLIAAGAVVIKREKNAGIFLGGLLMFVFAALGPATGNADLIFLISMIGELLMLLFFLVYARKENGRVEKWDT